MKLVKQLTKVYGIKSFKGGILYVDAANKEHQKLLYDKKDSLLMFDEFNVENTFINGNTFNCFAINAKDIECGTVMLDEHFNVLKRFCNMNQVWLASELYYCKPGLIGSNVASIINDQVVVKDTNDITSRGTSSLDNLYYARCKTDTGKIFINNLFTCTQKTVDFFANLDITEEDDRSVRFSHLFNNSLVVYIDGWFLIIDCIAGKIVYKKEVQFWFYDFKVVDGFLYANRFGGLTKFKIEENGLVEIYNHEIRLEDRFGGTNGRIGRMYICNKHIWAPFDYRPNQYLVQFNADTGDVIKKISLSEYGIKEVFELAVSDDKIYITNLNCTTWVFEKEADEK